MHSLRLVRHCTPTSLSRICIRRQSAFAERLAQSLFQDESSLVAPKHASHNADDRPSSRSTTVESTATEKGKHAKSRKAKLRKKRQELERKFREAKLKEEKVAAATDVAQRLREHLFVSAHGPTLTVPSVPEASERAIKSKEHHIEDMKKQISMLTALERTSLPTKRRDFFPPRTQKKLGWNVRKEDRYPMDRAGAGDIWHDVTMEDAKSKLGTNEADSWTSGWGPDELAPPSNPQDPGIRPPHPRPKLPYTRRIEGLINPEQRAVLQDIEPPSDHKPIANLAHGLDRVLFNPGVHWLRDPRSRVYNFTPWLEEIPEVTEFAFERLTGFIRSSRDEDLWSLAKAHDKTFAGSTSSLTGLLSHIYFLISQDRDVDLRSLSTHFANEPANFTPGQRMPVSLVFHHKDGRYAIDSDETVKGSSEKNILTWMGTLLENFLTKSPEDFSKLLRSNHVAPEEVDDRREAYRYAKSSTFVMRSQLDCQDRRLPGTGVFDIKTRAALPIRLDIMNYEENSGYLIRTAQGRLESFEKEYYDLIRSAFLKYSFQVRIGNMDGAIVAFHNTARIFGFQYIPLEEMDERLFGASDRGDRIFDKCVSLLEVVAAEIVAQYPGQSIRCMVEKLDRNPEMNVWVQPADSTDENDIVQLDVTVKNYVDDQEVSGARAVEATDAEWTVHWAISKSSLSPAEIRANLNYAKDRQFRAWALPSGLSVEQMEERWNSMNFGGSSSEGSSPFDPRLFYRAPFQTRMLRQLAREGRNDTEAWQEAERGLPKIIWGKPDEVRPEELDGEEGSVQPAAEAEEQVDVEGLLGDDLLPATTVERADSIPPNEQSEDPADDREAFLDPSVVANLEHAASLHRPHLHPDALLEDVDSSAPSVSVDEVDNNSSGSVTPSTYESRAPTYDMHSLGTAPTLGMEADLIQAVNSHLASLRNESAAASPPAAESPSDEPITEARERLSAEDPTPGPTEENVDSRKSSSP